MFGDEKTLSNVQNILAKQEADRSSFIAGDLGSGLDVSLKYMMQLYSDTYAVTLDTMNGTARCTTTSEVSGESSSNMSNSNLIEEGNGSAESERTEKQSEHEKGIAGIPFLHLPIQVHLHILSYLNASDICRLSATCQQCQSICADELLWRDVLKKEKSSWTELGNTSNPALYEDVNSDLGYKEIYMRCNPHCARQEQFDILSIPRFLWSFIPHKAPKVVMFGPGLDSDTSKIVHKLIGNDESGIFQYQGMFPASQPGVGTGFNISMNNKAQLGLITLYSGTKRDRTNVNIPNATRADRNKLLRPTAASNNPDGDETDLKYEPIPAVRDLCSGTDAFIFVVDSSASVEELPEGRPELFAMMSERWTPNKAPLLILSCVPDCESSKIPCVDVAEQLAMHRINRTWKMFDANVSTLSGVVEGITWLLEATNRR
ncbi:F-box only protein 4-like isoform X2 [Amphiura filiformis]|uniref:F-box only protein 4-like isoform X2 n=1 Tax=Amphiura filiformis TaxID=82378 RepID=UPI003B22396A